MLNGQQNTLTAQQTTLNSQQTTMNSCVVALGQVTIPEAPKLVLLPEPLPTGTTWKHTTDIIVLTNKNVPITRARLSCDNQIGEVSAHLAGSGTTIGEHLNGAHAAPL